MLAALDLREFGYVCNSLSVFRVAVIIRVPQKWGPLIPCAKECLCIIFIENRWSRCFCNYNTGLSIYLTVTFDLFTAFGGGCAAQAFGIVILKNGVSIMIPPLTYIFLLFFIIVNYIRVV